MDRFLTLALAVLLLAGCQPAKSPDSEMSRRLAVTFGNNRLKAIAYPDSPIKPLLGTAGADGIWLPDDSKSQPPFAEQVDISCVKGEGLCHELTIPLGVTSASIHVMHPEETLWPIKSWNADSIIASYGPVPDANPGSGDRCQRHVLSITLASGAVSTSVVPTNEKGCEAFQKVETSRLIQGNFYVDTTPDNDAGTAKKK